jgi:hypothetical protein
MRGLGRTPILDPNRNADSPVREPGQANAIVRTFGADAPTR